MQRADFPAARPRSLTRSLSLKVFSDDGSGAMWKKNVKDIDGEVLCVSQFTLFATTAKGKPDFHRAMVCVLPIFVLCPPPPADPPVPTRAPLAARCSQATGPSRDLYASFLNRMGELYGPDKIKGAFVPARSHTSLGPFTVGRAAGVVIFSSGGGWNADVAFYVNRWTVWRDDGCAANKRGA